MSATGTRLKDKAAITTPVSLDRLFVEDTDADVVGYVTFAQLITFLQTTGLDASAIQSGTVADARIPSGVTRDSELATVATSGDYGDLSNAPAIPADADDLTDGTTNKMFTATERTKLTGIETGATADQSGAEIVTAINSELSGTGWQSGGGGGAVDSVYGRTGAVVAATSDYDASQVDNDSGVTGATVAAALDTLDSGKAATGHNHDSDYAALDHDASHLRGGSDEIDGDKLDIDYTPANYTPDTTPAETDNVDDLSAHLKGISDALGAKAATGHNHDSDYAALSHTHPASEVTDFDTEVSNNTDVAANTTHRGVTTGNPHSVTKGDVGLANVPNADTTNASNIASGTLSNDRLATVPVTKGGTGATTAGAARTALGLDIGTDVAAEGHSHTASDVSDFDTEVANNGNVTTNTTHRGLTNNPHSVTRTQVGAIGVYKATITSSTGGAGEIITAATHGLAGDRGLTVTFYDGDGDAIDIAHSIAANGDVTWLAGEALTGTLVIQG